MFRTVTVLSLAIFCIHAAQNRGGRIIGGDVANAGQFPFVASIYTQTTSGTYFCGGTLIGNQWILTSARCVSDGVLFTIGLGSNQLNDANALRLATDRYIVHPDFNPETSEHDIGVITLREPVTYTDYISPVNLISAADLPGGTSVSTVGWGQTSDSQAGLSDSLNYVSLVTLSNEECRLIFGSQVKDGMVCVDGNYNEGTCAGDLGGPLLQRGILLTYLVGVSSFISSRGCESTDPSGFTRTAPYVEWIMNVTHGAN